jgi:hypothetical protein
MVGNARPLNCPNQTFGTIQKILEKRFCGNDKSIEILLSLLSQVDGQPHECGSYVQITVEWLQTTLQVLLLWSLNMPVVINQATNANAVQPRYADAIELARQCADQYHLNILPGAGGGIAGGSCWAAVAVEPNANFPNLDPINPAGAIPNGGGVHIGIGGLGYGISFGNSQMAMINGQVGLPGFGGGGHAERVAINNINPIANLHTPLDQAVMFVQLHPCNGPGTQQCQAWLNNLALGTTTLYVYYRFPHPTV